MSRPLTLRRRRRGPRPGRLASSSPTLTYNHREMSRKTIARNSSWHGRRTEVSRKKPMLRLLSKGTPLLISSLKQLVLRIRLQVISERALTTLHLPSQPRSLQPSQASLSPRVTRTTSRSRTSLSPSQGRDPPSYPAASTFNRKLSTASQRRLPTQPKFKAQLPQRKSLLSM